VGEAGGTGRVPWRGPRVTGKRAFGGVERELIVVGGSRQPRESADVAETGGDKGHAAAIVHVGG